ncbi:MAG TPA: hypothetical protein VFF88_10035 [Methylocella sp.]|nr:hypothetical protein [Methylocella sp.]
MSSRLNWVLFAAIVLLIGINTLLFVVIPRWQAAGSRSGPSCLKVSDFYSVHLTTYFLASSGGAQPDDSRRYYRQYCDELPGPGKAIFTVDLMEQDARDLPVGFSLSRYEPDGSLKLVKELPPSVHPGGVMTLETPVPERGTYLLKLAFGEAIAKDDFIEIPIQVGK